MSSKGSEKGPGSLPVPLFDESLEVFDYLDDVMRLATMNKLEVIVIGDLNCDMNATSRQKDRLLEFTMANELEQLINEPTRVTSTTSTLIDVLITSTPSLFKKAGVINIAFSDHYPIYGIMHGSATHPNKHRTITTRPWNDKKINNFVADLKQAPWSLIDTFTDVDNMCSAWESLMKSLIDYHFPLKKETHSKTDAPLARQYCSQTYENTRPGTQKGQNIPTIFRLERIQAPS